MITRKTITLVFLSALAALSAAYSLNGDTLPIYSNKGAALQGQTYTEGYQLPLTAGELNMSNLDLKGQQTYGFDGSPEVVDEVDWSVPWNDLEGTNPSSNVGMDVSFGGQVPVYAEPKQLPPDTVTKEEVTPSPPPPTPQPTTPTSPQWGHMGGAGWFGGGAGPGYPAGPGGPQGPGGMGPGGHF